MVIIVYFFKDNNSWSVAGAGSPEDKVQCGGAENVWNKMAYNNYLMVEFYPDDNGNKDKGNTSLLKYGYEPMFKVSDTPQGGGMYFCPKIKGETIDQYLWVNEVITNALGGVYDIIYFK